MKPASLLRLELMKLRSTPNYALLGLLTGAGFLIVFTIFAMNITVNGQEAGALLGFDDRFKSIYNRLSQLATFVMALIVIVNVGSEYRHLSFRRNVMDGLTRTQLFASKLLGILILSAVVLIISFILILIVGVGIEKVPILELAEAAFSKDLIRFFFKLIFAAGFGLFFILLFRTSIFAMIGLLSYLAFEMVFGLIERFRFQTDYAAYLPHNFVTDSIGLPELSVGKALLVGVYILAFYAFAWLILQRRDL